jgi:hypothetical protein
MTSRFALLVGPWPIAGAVRTTAHEGLSAPMGARWGPGVSRCASRHSWIDDGLWRIPGSPGQRPTSTPEVTHWINDLESVLFRK